MARDVIEETPERTVAWKWDSLRAHLIHIRDEALSGVAFTVDERDRLRAMMVASTTEHFLENMRTLDLIQQGLDPTEATILATQEGLQQALDTAGKVEV